MLTIIAKSSTLKGGSPCFFGKLDFEIAVDQQTKAHPPMTKLIKGVPDSRCPPVPAGQPRPYLVNFWLNFANFGLKLPNARQISEFGHQIFLKA